MILKDIAYKILTEIGWYAGYAWGIILQVRCARVKD